MSVGIVFAVGRAQRCARTCPAGCGWSAALVAWLGAIVFAAFGLFIGYLLPSENVMQILGPALALLALMGGIFVPLDQLSDTPADARRSTRRPTASASWPGPRCSATAWTSARSLNVVVWTAIFAAGAVVAVPPRHRPRLSTDHTAGRDRS